MSKSIFALTSAPPVFSFLLKELVNILTCLVVGSQPHSPLVAGGHPTFFSFWLSLTPITMDTRLDPTVHHFNTLWPTYSASLPSP